MSAMSSPSSPSVGDASSVADYLLRPDDFQKIARIVRSSAGIVLTERKRDLVYNRLSKRLRALRLESFEAYCVHLDGPEGAGEIRELLNAITTNLTSFFREKHHFDHLETVALKPLIAARARHGGRLRIWSAGCSTGEEPYSIGMTLGAVLPERHDLDARILATDIDTNVLARAEAGRYDAKALDTIPARYRVRYVTSCGDGQIAMSEELRRLIAFKPLNLLGDWPMRGPFDIIFCRNVVIYFDKQDQRALFDRYADYLAPDGLLYIGHSENLHGVTSRFTPIGRTIYRKVAC